MSAPGPVGPARQQPEGNWPYELLTEGTVSHHLQNRLDLAGRIDPTTVRAREVGDGNLNLVFVCGDDAGRSLVLKQALPYVRAAGPGWPLTPDRSHAEAVGLRAAGAASPDTAVELYGYDPASHVLAMEYLSEFAVWRSALNDGLRAPGAAALCGRHVAQLLFATGLSGLRSEEHREAVARHTNVALCRITEDLVFTDPFTHHERNTFDEALQDSVTELQCDEGLRAEAARLKAEFITRNEALVHGDLHTGSVMVRVDPATGETRLKIIDPEFCFYGPIAFDLGVLLGNLLFAHERALVLGLEGHRGWMESLPEECWAAFEGAVWERWPQRVDRSFTDAYCTAMLTRVKRDAIGFAACEAIRRVVGFAKVSDLESLPLPERHAASRAVLTAARRWLTTDIAEWSQTLRTDSQRTRQRARPHNCETDGHDNDDRQ